MRVHLRRGYARHLTILFPAVLVVAVYFLIQPGPGDNATPVAKPTHPNPPTTFEPRDSDYESERAVRREVTREIMIEHGLITPELSEEDTRTAIRSLMQGGEEREAVLTEVRLRLLERDIEPGRWYRRYWDEQLQGPFSPWGVGGFEGRGVTLGDNAPTPTVYTLEKAATPLADVWSDMPALIVTGSVTCPYTHLRIAELDALAKRFDGRVRVVLVYTTEALPNNAVAPGPAGEALEVTQMLGEAPSYPQTTSLSQRVDFAAELRDTLGIQTPILIDGMDNALWESFGQAPSAALFVSPDGKVVTKQGWFEAYSMSETIDEWLMGQR